MTKSDGYDSFLITKYQNGLQLTIIEHIFVKWKQSDSKGVLIT